ncbi:MAG: type II toxin-antitoxin system HicB family antitoxin [Planctomycetota bacterium]|nr:MAG: type II toxin-antitoxin system HicB family antitoxin [Planctomycetota bacterium]REK27210.1 MAG: type II toxin-antitoxin system HicB family antitoxin [Planctomycetota bacterium]REK36769.1 MAG: type II toxin-antitoxin system HicB family antitoxin [Planctomycetota bacterium]
MLTYKAMYVFCDDGVHAEVLDFPGAISSGADLDEARRMLQDALVVMAETHLLKGEPLPLPDPGVFDDDADLDEPIYLLFSAASSAAVVPQEISA